jgi:hypothetical protein
MITLRKSELLEFAQIFMLANTPLSLFNGMIRCAGMENLRKAPLAQLNALYDRVTARAERSEVVAALAYAVLCAVVVQARTLPDVDIDASRLQWGAAIWEFKKRSEIGTSLIIVPSRNNPPRISLSTSPSNDQHFSLYDASGNPLAE